MFRRLHERLGPGTSGVEYVVEHSQEPHLFVIRKQMRSGIPSEARTDVQAYFYVLDGKVVQAPSLFQVCCLPPAPPPSPPTYSFLLRQIKSCMSAKAYVYSYCNSLSLMYGSHALPSMAAYRCNRCRGRRRVQAAGCTTGPCGRHCA